MIPCSRATNIPPSGDVAIMPGEWRAKEKALVSAAMAPPRPFAVLRGHEDEVVSCDFVGSSHIVSWCAPGAGGNADTNDAAALAGQRGKRHDLVVGSRFQTGSAPSAATRGRWSGHGDELRRGTASEVCDPGAVADGAPVTGIVRCESAVKGDRAQSSCGRTDPAWRAWQRRAACSCRHAHSARWSPSATAVCAAPSWNGRWWG